MRRPTARRMRSAASVPPRRRGRPTQQLRTDALRLLHRAAATFQVSERATRAVLWSGGEQAPYGIPLPELIPARAPSPGGRPPCSGPPDEQYWTAANGLRINVDARESGPQGRRHVALRPGCAALRRGRGRQAVPASMADPTSDRRAAARTGRRSGPCSASSLAAPRRPGRSSGDQRRVRRSSARTDGGLSTWTGTCASSTASQGRCGARAVAAGGVPPDHLGGRCPAGKVFTWRVPYDKGGTRRRTR